MHPLQVITVVILYVVFNDKDYGDMKQKTAEGVGFNIYTCMTCVCDTSILYTCSGSQMSWIIHYTIGIYTYWDILFWNLYGLYILYSTYEINIADVLQMLLYNNNCTRLFDFDNGCIYKI